MNTTKDECDGWVDAKVKALVGIGFLVIDKNQNMNLAYQDSGGNWLKWATHTYLRDVTHWRELPEPPKPKDAFETWWNTLTPDKTNGHEFRYVHHDHGMVVKFAAKAIWEAAINSTKQ